MVTDHGFAARELDLAGADPRSFPKVAASIAEAAGIEVSDKCEFRVVVDEDQLEGAIKVVANCA